MASASRRPNSSLPAGYKEDKSKGALLRFEDSLPRLPIPTLEETGSRYLKTLEPLLSQAELAESKKAVDEFIAPNGPGRKLQERLVARRDDPKHKNWLHEWWNDTAYLSYREPLLYVSYFYSHRDDRRRRDPAKRAASIVTAALEFKKQMDTGVLEPEYMRKLPISMESYQWMFNAIRIPAKPADYPIAYDPKKYKHFVAVRKNQFFRVDYEVGGRPLNTSELEKQFKRIYSAAASRVPAIGALTTQNRDVWTDAREVLIKADPANAAALEEIASAAFLVCLDDAAPVTLEERAHQYWHGDGQNRWADKPLQFIVNDNGTSGFMGEHSMMDGTPTHRLNDYIGDAVAHNRLDFSNPDIRSNLPEPTPLRFRVTEEVQAAIDRATRDFAVAVSQHELAVQAYQGYGKGLIKKFKCSPDAYVQMLIQLAYHRMFGQNRPTYESAATRRFQQGRTETCRSVSSASAAWCTAMADPAVEDAERVKLFRAAIDAHLEYLEAALGGKGVDRHLFGLKKLLKEGEPLPSIYSDPAYAYSSSWFLSTSQLSSEFFNGYGWSQVIDAGFGIAYMINENSISLNIVSKGLGSQKMSFYLSEAANEMRDLLLPTVEPPKAKL